MAWLLTVAATAITVPWTRVVRSGVAGRSRHRRAWKREAGFAAWFHLNDWVSLVVFLSISKITTSVGR